MATKKATTKKTTAKKAPAKKTAEKAAPSAPAKKTTEKKAPVEKKAAVEKKAVVEKKTPAKKAPAKKAAAKKAPAKEAPEKKAPAKEAPEKKAAPAVAPAKETVAKEAPAKETVAKEAPPPVRAVPAVSSGMTLEDAQKILAEVQAAQKQPKGPCRAALPLRFTNQRKPSHVGELNPNEMRQLVAAGVHGTGKARTPEGWLDPAGAAASFYGQLEVWDVVDAHGIPVYSVWMYQSDNGTVFRAGSIDVVGGVSRGGLECAEEGLEEALLDAKSRVDKKLVQTSLLRFMG